MAAMKQGRTGGPLDVPNSARARVLAAAKASTAKAPAVAKGRPKCRPKKRGPPHKMLRFSRCIMRYMHARAKRARLKRNVKRTRDAHDAALHELWDHEFVREKATRDLEICGHKTRAEKAALLSSSKTSLPMELDFDAVKSTSDCGQVYHRGAENRQVEHTDQIFLHSHVQTSTQHSAILHAAASTAAAASTFIGFI